MYAGARCNTCETGIRLVSKRECITVLAPGAECRPLSTGRFMSSPYAANRPQIIDVSEGIMCLRLRNIVHGDFKPVGFLFVSLDVVIGGEGNAMICDFGLFSIILDLSTYAEGSGTISTMWFTSPRVLDGRVSTRDKGNDVWASCTSGQILFDTRPYHACGTDHIVLRAARNEPPHE
ncbi:uncharacterized protein EI90DRAFT_2598189 [Cantharellus anzutake]|uniref:uncharacterized protein n=1 Tax=Cantharellus anzutake TaxID=1750568 RepID=UPI0019086216|nr:uncharacterized protein EI90DRAFT_2598189 [Cantharellus anzutake]KAF8320526.1 hypothetical protein EI90DRAFT_2598189 [Cantharellus anzutake]